MNDCFVFNWHLPFRKLKSRLLHSEQRLVWLTHVWTRRTASATCFYREQITLSQAQNNSGFIHLIMCSDKPQLMLAQTASPDCLPRPPATLLHHNGSEALQTGWGMETCINHPCKSPDSRMPTVPMRLFVTLTGGVARIFIFIREVRLLCGASDGDERNF